MLIEFFLILFSLLLFSLKGYLTLDPDFGWHLKMGQLITSSGIPSLDPFSYTMAHFPYVDHSWLSDVYIAGIYNHLGIPALSVIFGLIMIFSVWLVLPSKTNSKLRYFLAILALGTILPFSGIRPQVQSWLFLALLTKLVFNLKVWRKFRFFIPLLFLLWANLHGSFAVGLALLTTYVFTKSIRLKKVDLLDFSIIITSTLVTLINPYGIGLWREVVSTLTSTNLKANISEWLPAFLTINLPFIFLACFSGTLVWKYRQKLLLEEVVIYLVFLFEAISSVRQVPLWTIVSLPVTIKASTLLFEEIGKITHGARRLQKSLTYALLVVSLILAGQIYFEFRSSINAGRSYPTQAVNYLKTNLPSGNIFADYNWGGYLIWKLPEKKTFIDGRMPAWRYQSCPPNETCNAMQDYLDIMHGTKDYHPFFAKYQINTVLAANPQNAPGTTLLEIIAKLFRKSSSLNLSDKLIQDGWHEVYQDNVSDILQR